MICYNKQSKLDLYTYDLDLISWINQKYPRKLSSENYKIDKTAPGEKELFCLYDLDKKDLVDILKNIKKGYYEYELRDSSTGDFLQLENLLEKEE